jgi:hypothetical protein
MTVSAATARLLPGPTPDGERAGSTTSDWFFVAGAFVVAFGVIVSRRPDALLHPQFWAEDGSNFWRRAYLYGGLQEIFRPDSAGYIQLLPRLAAAVYVHLPLQWVPALFNVTAITVQALPAVLLVSRRCESAVPDRRIRILLALAYLAVPASAEIDANLVNAQFHLAVLAVIIVLMAPSRRWGRAVEAAALFLAGLSGPFSLAMVPVALIAAIVRRSERWRLWRLLILAATAVVQLADLFTQASLRVRLGASPHGLIRILANRVILQSLLGARGAPDVAGRAFWLNSPLPLLAACLGLALLGWALVRATFELQLFILFAGLILAGSLAHPRIGGSTTAWPAMAQFSGGGRYFVIPIIAILWTLIWLVATHRPLVLRCAGALALVLAVGLGVRADWEYPPYRDFHFAAYSAKFDRARPGQLVTIPENPGGGWKITIIKK